LLELAASGRRPSTHVASPWRKTDTASPATARFPVRAADASSSGVGAMVLVAVRAVPMPHGRAPLSRALTSVDSAPAPSSRGGSAWTPRAAFGGWRSPTGVTSRPLAFLVASRAPRPPAPAGLSTLGARTVAASLAKGSPVKGLARAIRTAFRRTAHPATSLSTPPRSGSGARAGKGPLPRRCTRSPWHPRSPTSLARVIRPG